MSRTTRRIGLLAATGLLLASCNDVTPDEESLAQVEQALNVCNATVAANLIVDGIPAYAQCATSTNAAIYSNNGVDTATSAASTDWKRTQFSGGYQCTELVHRYWLFKWNVTWIPNGDAWSWCNATPPSSSGIVQTTIPVHGDAIVFARGACGADTTYGHIALVDTVDTAGSKVTYVEQNNAGRRTGAFSCATCFLHVVANSGTGGAGGAAGTTATTGGTSSTGGTTAKPTGGTSSTGGTTAKPTGGTSSTGGSVTVGGSTASVNGGTSGSTGGMAPAGGTTHESGGSNGSVTGSTTAGTVPYATSTEAGLGGSAPSATTTENLVAGNEVADEEAGCACNLPNRNAPSRSLGLFALGALLLLRTRNHRSRTAR